MSDREPANIMNVVAFPEPDKAKRQIRFIDAEYNTVFTIPDGGSIVVTRMSGTSVVRACAYIDDYHTLVGDEVFHICQFARQAERAGAVYEPLAPEYTPAGGGTYEIYQIDRVGAVDYTFMSYDRAKDALRASDYQKVYAGVLAPSVTADRLYQRHNGDTRPFSSRMRALSVSDVLVLKRGGEKRAYYVDTVGFKEVPQFLRQHQQVKEANERFDQ